MSDFVLVVVEGSYASGVTTAVDMLAAARELALEAKAPIPTWRIASPTGGHVCLDSGFSVDTVPLPQGEDSRSIWVIPAVVSNSEMDLLDHLSNPQWQALGPLLRDHISRNGRVAACASAVFLLAQAGVLAGYRVTTSWWLAPALHRLTPDAIVDTHKSLCVDGPLTTCGPAFAQAELMLHLIGELCGPRVAEKLTLLWMRNGDAAHPAADLLRSYTARDAMVARIIDSVERRLPDSPSVSELAHELAMSERTLSRYVRRITGKSTIALVQDVRLRRARSLLERSRMSIDQVAAAVGYSDPTALRRLMKRVTGAQPSHYRSASLVG